MDKKAFDVFDKIHAEDELKRTITNYLHAEINKRKREKNVKKRKFAIACASLTVFLICGAFFYQIYFTPVAYIDIDINPSIEFSINRLGKVIRSSAYNEDGMKILDEINVYCIGYNKAFKRLLDAMDADKYFAQDNLLYVTVQTNESRREDRMLNGLQKIINITNEKYHYNIVADIYAVTEDVKHYASENQISPAKYLAIQDLLEVDSSAVFEECKEHSIHELHQLTDEKCAEHKEHDDSHNHNEDGHHH